jgi:hypothetical protein
MLKNKNEKWSEKVKVVREKTPLSEEHEAILLNLNSYVNENRFNNVVSKLPEIDYTEKSNIGKLIKMVRLDALEDYQKDNGEIDPDVLNVVNKGFINAVKNVVLVKF